MRERNIGLALAKIARTVPAPCAFFNRATRVYARRYNRGIAAHASRPRRGPA